VRIVAMNVANPVVIAAMNATIVVTECVRDVVNVAIHVARASRIVYKGRFQPHSPFAPL